MAVWRNVAPRNVDLTRPRQCAKLMARPYHVESRPRLFALCKVGGTRFILAWRLEAVACNNDKTRNDKFLVGVVSCGCFDGVLLF